MSAGPKVAVYSNDNDDVVVLIFRLGTTPPAEARRTVELIRREKIAGCVLSTSEERSSPQLVTPRGEVGIDAPLVALLRNSQ